MTPPEFERARSAEAKRARESAILDAAARLATERGVRTVTLTDIAATVGMHKSAMLRYFETREEIFLRLSASEWTAWSQAVRDQLGQRDQLELATGLDSEPETPHATATASKTRTAAIPTISTIASILADTLVARPLFCDLLAHTPLNLERGVSFASVRAFKTTVVAEVGAVGTALCEALPLTAGQGIDAVATATSMAGALWQMAAPGTELRRFYEETPELAHAIVDVAPRVTSIMTALLRGYCAEN